MLCHSSATGFPLQLPPAASACGLPLMDNGGQQMPNGVVSGAAALIDARVEWAAHTPDAASAGDASSHCAERAVLRSNRSVYLRNLYASGADLIALGESGTACGRSRRHRDLPPRADGSKTRTHLHFLQQE